MAASRYRLRASSSHRWVRCYGSPGLEAKYPQEPHESAAEGDAGHWVGAELIAGRIHPEGTFAPNGVIVTEEMIKGAAMLAEAVLTRIPAENARIEQSVSIARVHPDNGGTPDAAGLGFVPTVLHVIDYKFGHDYVEPFECWQCIDYVVGVFDQLVAEGVLREIDEQTLTVCITIVQPRNYHPDGPVRSWTVPMRTLRPYVNQLSTAAYESAKENPATRSGEWCVHCDAVAHCVTAQRAGYQVCDIAGDSVPFDLDSDQVGIDLRRLETAAKIVQARIDGLKVEAAKMIGQGKRVPHYKIEHGFGNLAWKNPEGAITLGDLLGLQFRKKQEPITPTQAKDMGADPAVIEATTYRPPKKAKLVQFDEKSIRKINFGEKQS